MRNRPSTTYKTDTIFHNDFLEVLEDCINESNLNHDQKVETNLMLYRHFYEHKVNHNAIVIKPTFKPRIIMDY